MLPARVRLSALQTGTCGYLGGPAKVTRAGCGHTVLARRGGARGHRALRKRTCSGNVAARLPT